MSSNGTKAVNRLDRRELRFLEDLVDQHRQEIEAGKWTAGSFAAFAERRMNRPLTRGNIVGAARTMQVVFQRKGGSPARYGNNTRELRACIHLLACELAQLKRELGQTVSPALEGLTVNPHEPGRNGEDS